MKEQNIYISKVWGELTFIPTNRDGKYNCRHCLLRMDNNNGRIAECALAPCCNRPDGKKGYFTIHQMPEPREQKGKMYDV